MDIITVVVGTTRIETKSALLARQVLERSTGLAQQFSEAIIGTIELTAQPPSIGQPWPGQGGIYAGLMRGENGTPDYHLIVPTSPTAAVDVIPWGSHGKSEDGAISDADGLANTRALVDSKHSHPAAEWAACLEVDEHRDFYLPARRELRLCWVNVPELFPEGWHWSSTQYSPHFAWLQVFGGGDQSLVHEDIEFRARAVRRILTTSTL